jgi:hypothetical protein
MCRIAMPCIAMLEVQPVGAHLSTIDIKGSAMLAPAHARALQKISLSTLVNRARPLLL